ncbi:MAG: hypothetical protein ACOX4D_08095 [Bacteroidales bacterium]|jgi:gas vesicle protein
MKFSNVVSFLVGATLATGITLLFTTDKGKEIRDNVSDKLSKEELEKMLDGIKDQIKKLEESLLKAKDNTKSEIEKLLQKLKIKKKDIENALENLEEAVVE